MSAESAQLARQIDEQVAVIEAELKRAADEQAAAVTKIRETAAQAAAVLSQGQIDDGQSAELESGRLQPLEARCVKRGEVIQLSIGPRGNHGADSTLIELEIAEQDGERRRWSVADLVPDLGAGNPHADPHGHAAVWCFLDLRDGPRLLPESVPEISGRRELQAWRNGDTPSVLVNSSEQPVKVWTELPPRKFFVHPGPQGPVAVAWISPLDGVVSIRGRIADAHPGGPDGVDWRLEHFASAEVGQALVGQGEYRGQLTEATRRRAELNSRRPVMPVAYAVSEGTPQHARIQRRGDPANLGDEVPRKFLDLCGGQPVAATDTSGRLELAQWLTEAANPLTPRVIVNRVWQWHFGRGLVATPNDFGTRGAEPTHPQLLDHLAAEFVQSGWRLKELHRRIVLSATYQQASGSSQGVPRYDAFPRRRLTAEELRDTLLVASGELDRTPGGTHPFPPEATWSFSQHAPFAAEYETLQTQRLCHAETQSARPLLCTVRRSRSERQHSPTRPDDGADSGAVLLERSVPARPGGQVRRPHSGGLVRGSSSLGLRVRDPVRSSRDGGRATRRGGIPAGICCRRGGSAGGGAIGRSVGSVRTCLAGKQ